MADRYGNIQISEQQFQELQQAYTSGNYTQYHFLKSQFGSTISKLYIPGPTGQGIFGSLSHLYTQDYIGSQEFLNRQTEISSRIIENDLTEIQNSRVGDSYYLPTVKRTLELEIAIWEALGYPAESYAGQQLIDLLALKNVRGDVNVSIWSIFDDLAESGYDAFIAENTYTGETITYKGVQYQESDFILVEDVYFVRDGNQLVPVGITDTAIVRAYQDVQYAAALEALLEEGGEIDFENHPYAKVFRDRLEKLDPRCFAAGTQIDMADGTTKSIETIQVGDEVMAYDPEAEAGRGGLKPARVTRTMVNQVPHLLDFHGVKVTPGHATLCGDGPNEGNHIPLMDILLADGAVVNRDGELVRAATNLPVGSEGDQFVEVAYLTSKSQKTYFRGRMRAGTLTLDAKGKTHRVLDALNREGYRLLPDGLIAKDGETPHPLYWFGELPKPADYVLAKSGLTLAELYSAEGQELDRPAAPASSSKIGAELGAVYAGMSVN